ncbi:MAG: DUF929 family protein [Candidatus Micrarchaeaceae archaeon]
MVEVEKEIKEVKKLEATLSSDRNLIYVALAIGIVAIASSLASLAFVFNLNSRINALNYTTHITATTTIQGVSGYNINSALITPPLSLAEAPVITQQQPFGSRLTNINAPLNSTELAIINNAPDAYFETAGEMYLNHEINNTVSAQAAKVPLFVVNGKPSVIYFGSITCIFCGENKWAMVLALSRFGNFTALFKGYSALGDGDLPTLYWAPAHYNQSSIDLGNFYNSKYINLITLEDTAPITGGFNLQPLGKIQQEINATGNLAYIDAIKFILQLNTFQGTPYTIWGSYNVGGADAVDFGNTMPTSGQQLPLTYMTHEQVLSQLANPSNQFAWTEYAAADLYVAMVCGSINNAAPVCSLPAIKQIEAANGY